MAIAAVGNNLITYVFNDMHYSLPKSANIVTNFVGTIFLLSILGGFLTDSYLGSFLTIIVFGLIELIVHLSHPSLPMAHSIEFNLWYIRY
jgi:dipeptide/tripeptide permease